MSNVVDFPPGRRGQAAFEADQRTVRAERASALREMLRANCTRPMSHADQVTVAEGVWRLLDRVGKHGVTKAQVLQRATNARKEDSTKWLGQYALNPSRPEQAKGGARLNKKPGMYAKVINAAAEMAGIEPDEALLDVFGATSLAASGRVRTAAPEYEELARRLREIGNAVAAKHDLQSYFQEVKRARICLRVANSDEDTSHARLNSEDIALEITSGGMIEEWPIPLYQFSYDHQIHARWETVPLYPSIVLGKWDIGEPHQFRFDQVEGPDGAEPVASPTANTIEGTYEAELRLCIVPTGPDLRPETVLRVVVGLCCLTSLSDPPDYAKSGPDFQFEGELPTTTPKPKISAASRGQEGVTYRFWSCSPILPQPIETYFPTERKTWRGGCRFFPMTGVVAQDWFSLDMATSDPSYGFYEPLHERVLGHALLQTFAGYFSPFDGCTVAAGLDHCLSGSQDSNPLDLLGDRARQLTKLFRDAAAAAKAERDAAVAQLDARVLKMCGEVPTR